MSMLDDINRMRMEGKSDLEITSQLRQGGLPDRVISDAIAQSKIKDAVNFPANPDNNSIPQTGEMQNQQTAMNQQFNTSQEQDPYSQFPQQQQQYPNQPQEQTQYPGQYEEQQYGVEEYSGMQPSMLGAPQAQIQPQTQPMQQYPDQYTTPQEQYGAPQDQYAGYDAYSQYQPYQQQVSSDIITEISEQVVSEKLSSMQDRLEKAIDFRTVAEAKMTSLAERLKRIEEIMDRLQLSILQKVGDYVSDVGDIKKEIRENQESFKALLPKLREIHDEKHTRKVEFTQGHHETHKKKSKKHHP